MTWTFPDNPVALDDLLRANGIDTSQWGAGRSKTVADLWAEIVAGETRLRTQPFRREVLGVVEVIIRKGDHILIESCQTFQSGLQRSREIPPSEKMQPGETALDTAQRCLKEELGLPPDAITSVVSIERTREKVRISPSYPGLTSLYPFHMVEVHVIGLPQHDFSTDEYSPKGQEKVMTHDWTWQLTSLHAR